MPISNRVLQAFLVLAEVRKFTVAAERCHMTQSALSQLIATLEGRVGVRLFERGTRSVSLTPEGERLAISARRITTELETALGDLRAIAQMEQGHVSMAIVPSLAAFWIPEILRAYRAQFPKIRLHLHDASSARCHEMVRLGQVDFSLSSQPGVPGEVEAELLFEEALYIAFPVGHPLGAQRTMALAELQGVEFIHLQGTGQMLVRTGAEVRPAKQVLMEAGIVDVGLEVVHMATQAGLVAAGLGACLTPQSSRPQFDVLGLPTVQMDPAAIVRPIYLSQPKRASLSVAATEFQNFLRRWIAQERVGEPASASLL